MVLLIDERPEEVTDFQRSVKAEVVASSNDQDLETHVRLSRFMIERCRRMVESGKDVFVLLDSITRVARAYNSVHGGSGRTMTGGVDARALEIPRKMFASARKIEEGGSLTIIATALVDTGSRMDELIFQEFKGTGNMELILDRKLSDRRLFPGHRHSQERHAQGGKAFPSKNIEAIRKLRRMMVDLNPIEAMETLLAALKKHKTNDELLAKLVETRAARHRDHAAQATHRESAEPNHQPLRVRRWSGCCAFIRRSSPGKYPNATTLARGDRRSAPNPSIAISNSCATGWNLPLEYDAARKRLSLHRGSQHLSHPANHRGRIVRAAGRGKSPATISRHHLRESARSAPSKKWPPSLPDTVSLNLADWEQTISFRTRAEPILNLEIFDTLAKAAAPAPATGIDLPQTRPAASRELRVVDPYHLANINGEWFLFAWSFAQGHPHLCARAHQVHEAHRQDLSPPAKILAGKTPARQLRRAFRRRANLNVVIRFNERWPITSAKKNGTTRSNLSELKDGGVELRMKLSSLAGSRALGSGLGRQRQVSQAAGTGGDGERGGSKNSEARNWLGEARQLKMGTSSAHVPFWTIDA